jgi:hypothetical protein
MGRLKVKRNLVRCVGCADYVYPIQHFYKSSEYDSESEEEKPKVQFRPVFVPKWVFCNCPFPLLLPAPHEGLLTVDL